MASAKTSSFILTERLSVPANNVFAAETLDIGSYIDVGDRQALAIESVDFIFQDDTDAGAAPALGANESCTVQLLDRNRQSLAYADNIGLIASGMLHQDSQNGYSHDSDVFPDNFGKDSQSRIVVNDQLYFIGKTTAGSGGAEVTVRVQAKIVSLTAKDWMAIAIQSTAADN